MSQSPSYKELLSTLMREEGVSVVKKIRSILKRIETNQSRIEMAMSKVESIKNLHAQPTAFSTIPSAPTKHRPK